MIFFRFLYLTSDVLPIAHFKKSAIIHRCQHTQAIYALSIPLPRICQTRREIETVESEKFVIQREMFDLDKSSSSKIKMELYRFILNSLFPFTARIIFGQCIKQNIYVNFPLPGHIFNLLKSSCKLYKNADKHSKRGENEVNLCKFALLQYRLFC